MSINVVKRDGSVEPYDGYKIARAIEAASAGLDNQVARVTQLQSELEITLFDGITSQQLDEAVVQVALQNVRDDPAFDTVAARVLLKTVYKRVLGDYETAAELVGLHRKRFPGYVAEGVAGGLLDERLATHFDLDRLAAALDPSRDDLLRYIGAVTMSNRYMINDRDGNRLEVPQFFWMRVAMGLALNEADPTAATVRFYDKMSRLDYLAAGSTLVNAGTAYSQLSNCFVMEMQDDIEHIAKSVRDVMWLTKGTGGIGLSVTKLRAEGSPIRSNNTVSTGPIPFMHTIDSTLRAVSRGGKKFGALCFYVENWHLDFPQFLDLKQNAGDPYRRIRTANTAVWISDEFMTRVATDDDWYLFDPLDVPDLPELYGAEFSRRYAEYVVAAEAGELRTFTKIKAREQFRAILVSLQTTSHPWLTWKDTINNRALNNNTGTIHLSNLCTEITLPQDRDNIAVCNLASVNLSQHLERRDDERAEWSAERGTSGAARGGSEEPSATRNLERRGDERAEWSAERGTSGAARGGSEEPSATRNLEPSATRNTANDAIDWDRLRESVRLAVRQLDNLIDITISSVPESERSNELNRAVGLGVMGFTDVVERLGWSYESEQAYDLIDRLMEFVSYHAIDQSADLARERGSYPNFEGSRWSQGMVPIDTVDLAERQRGVPITVSRSSRLDWDALRAKVRGGMRNATLMAIAPTASIGLVAGTTPGLDPQFSQIFSRATSSGKFLEVNRNLVADLKARGLWDEVREDLLRVQGDVSALPAVPDDLKAIYKTSFQLSPYAFIEVAARAQKWIDQAISRNMYLATRDMDDYIKIYSAAWEKGVKTTYYLHVKPRHTAEQSTVRVNKAESPVGSGAGSAGGPRRRGFGAAARTASAPAPVPVPVPSNVGPVADTPVGVDLGVLPLEVGANRTGMVQQLQDQRDGDELDGVACPVDPQERLQCESCQ